MEIMGFCGCAGIVCIAVSSCRSVGFALCHARAAVRAASMCDTRFYSSPWLCVAVRFFASSPVVRFSFRGSSRPECVCRAAPVSSLRARRIAGRRQDGMITGRGID